MNYDVRVTREAGAWLADVPDVPGAHTFARSLAGLSKSVREVIVLMTDQADDAAVDITFTFDVADPLVTKAAAVGFQRSEIAAREAELRKVTASLALDLSRHGYSVRDAAQLLAMTPGRVSQLTNT